MSKIFSRGVAVGRDELNAFVDGEWVSIDTTATY